MMAPFIHIVGSDYGEEILGERQGDFKKLNRKAHRMKVMKCFLHTFNLSIHPKPDMALKHITPMTPEMKGS